MSSGIKQCSCRCCEAADGNHSSCCGAELAFKQMILAEAAVWEEGASLHLAMTLVPFQPARCKHAEGPHGARLGSGNLSGFNRLWSKPPGRKLVLVGEVMHLSHCFPSMQHAQIALQAKNSPSKQIANKRHRGTSWRSTCCFPVPYRALREGKGRLSMPGCWQRPELSGTCLSVPTCAVGKPRDEAGARGYRHPSHHLTISPRSFPRCATVTNT